jgi:hypothetical protein
MAMPTLEKDFKEFLKSFNSNGVEYLLIGGYALNIHGYVRTTNDMDVWVRVSSDNAARIDRALREFGFTGSSLRPDLFLVHNNIVRMGVPPLRIEILTSISGVDFDECYKERLPVQIEDLLVPVISLPRLRENKAASGRSKDLADLDGLPQA